MNGPDARVERWLADLAVALESAALIVARGREAYDSDLAIRLAFEALSNRVGELSKRLLVASPKRFSHPIWTQAARHRDFVVHRYDRINHDDLWVTVSADFPRLAALVIRARADDDGAHN